MDSDRRRRGVHRFGLLLLAIQMLGACAGYLVSDDGPAPVTVTGVADGALINRAECAWITLPSGERLEAWYPVGWTWRVGPLRVDDPSGRTVIRAGDVVTLRGVFGEVGESVCEVGELFDVRAVISVTASPAP
jgi:hypothetical protein